MEANAPVTLSKSLSPIHVCALALGCIIGWTAFHEPGNSYLRGAGPAGTLLAIGTAALAMLLFCVNYGFMVTNYPVAGGEFAYARRTFGERHGFVCAWLLSLAYLSPIPLNATAIGYFSRAIFHNTLMTGPYWNIAGYNVYLSALVVSILALAIVATLCVHGVRDTGVLQTILVLALVGGVAIVTAGLAVQPSAWAEADPALHPKPCMRTFAGFLAVLAVAPCLFIGFDTVPQSVEEFAFPYRRAWGIMAASILVGSAIYAALVLIAAAAPAGSADRGAEAFPAFHAAYRLLGGTGLALLFYAAIAAMLTGILGFLMAESRLLWSMGRTGTLPPWFARISQAHRTPRNAILFAAGVAGVAALFGRSALGWFVDLCSLGATVGYGYTSAATFCLARRKGDRAIQASGAAGVVLSLLFAALLIVPIPGLDCSMKRNTWICLAVWTFLGLLLRLVAKRA